MDSKSSRFIATIGPRTGCPLRTHGELFSVPFSVTVYFRRRYCSMLPLVAANDKNSVEVVVDVS